MAMTQETKARLQRAHVALLENIDDPDDIIQHLHARGVLSKTVKEKIESNKIPREQLKALLNVIPKRGEAAFEDLVQVLVKTGHDIAAKELSPEMYAKLKKGIPLHPGKGQTSEISLPEDDELPNKWPNRDEHDWFKPKFVDIDSAVDLEKASYYQVQEMKERFKRAIEGKISVYPMHRKRRGLFLLISNYAFEEARKNKVNLSDRDGTDKDAHAIHQIFEGLHFEVDKKENCTAEEMLKEIQTAARLDHTNTDCFGCAVLTHGEKGKMYGTDGDLVDLDEFLNAVDGHKCQTLVGKPKLFFIQACQGDNKDSGTSSGGSGAAGPDIDIHGQRLAKYLDDKLDLKDGQMEPQTDSKREPKKSAFSDYFIAMATVDSFVSWRIPDFGTWFIQAIIYVIGRHAWKYDLVKLMTLVNRLVQKAETSKGGNKQLPILKTTLASDLFFFPGLDSGR